MAAPLPFPTRSEFAQARKPSGGEDVPSLANATRQAPASQGTGPREQLPRPPLLQAPARPLPQLTPRPRSGLYRGHCSLRIVPAGGGLRTRMQTRTRGPTRGSGAGSGSLRLTCGLATPPSAAQLTASPPPPGISRAPPRSRAPTGPAPSSGSAVPALQLGRGQ
ncbi:uncharacterized protein DKFZp434B061-like [Meles meles]|uniref:uncharacterized protein DKFZp434B061-like n=1 Tax=Meles meles TaxID=9662 RepID=UPI001E69EC2B|nr:uncharacterized protein DKFZp434B061-like [Meles meles]